MTLSTCDQVTERIALGEPLGELAGHTETCESCRNLVAVSTKLTATRHDVDPGLGFSARMTVGAQHRLVARRRQRVAAGLAATVASGLFGVFVVTRTGDDPQPVAVRLPPQPTIKAPVAEEPPPVEVEAEDDDLAALIQLADVETNSRASANWGRIEKPLRPYKKLLKGVTP